MLEGNGTVKVISKLDSNVQNEDSNYDEHFGMKSVEVLLMKQPT